MYFNDLKIETAVHQYFLLAEKKDFFTAESNSLEFIRSGHILLYRKRDNRIADLYAGALFWMRKGDSYLFAPVPGNQSPSGKYTEHLYLDFTGPRSERMVEALETLYPQGVFHPSCPEEISNIFFRILQLYRIDPESFEVTAQLTVTDSEELRISRIAASPDGNSCAVLLSDGSLFAVYSE